MTLQQTFHERFREALARIELRQVDLAREMHISKSRVNNWHQGRAVPRVKHLVTMAAIFNVSTDWLVGMSDRRR